MKNKNIRDAPLALANIAMTIMTAGSNTTVTAETETTAETSEAGNRERKLAERFCDSEQQTYQQMSIPEAAALEVTTGYGNSRFVVKTLNFRRNIRAATES